MVALFILIAFAVLSVLAGVHWYLWRRLVRDVSVRGGWWRRTGTVLAVALPLTTFATMLGGQAGFPFAVERVLAWPGFLWLALLLYLSLTLLAAEPLRPLLRWALARRATSPAPAVRAGGASEADTAGAPAAGDARGEARAAAPTGGAGGEAPEAGRGAEPHTRGSGDEALHAAEPHVDAAGKWGSPPAARPRGRERGDDPARPGEPTAEGSGAEPRGQGAGDAGVTRRLFVARTVALGAATVATTTVTAGAISVLNGPATKHVTVPLTKLPRRAHGYRIAVVSDMHLGPVLGSAHTRRVVDTINRAQPDLVAIVGDLVDGTVADLGPAAEPLTGLRSRHGTYFVTGNHEYFGDAQAWIDHLQDLGVHPLENARKELPGFDLAGVNDLAGEEEGEGPDFEAALGGRETSRASVLLAHQPVQIHDAVDHGVDLQLSGHTHGGQLWPGPYLAALANPTVAGLERYGDTQLYVTRGAGTWGPPVRVGAESDITVVTLASQQT